MATSGRVGRIRWSFGDIADGDLAVGGPPELLDRRRGAMCPQPAAAWTALRQVHGAEVVVVHRPGEHRDAEADAAVTSVPGAVLSVTTADCAPVLLVAPGGADPVVGAAHAGWRGLRDGVLEATVAAMGDLGAGPITGLLGPCISPEAYEFGAADLTALALQFGPDVVGVTSEGRPAFDLRAAVRTALRSCGVEVDLHGSGPGGPPCTALGGGHFSWRHGHTPQRQASIIWIEP